MKKLIYAVAITCLLGSASIYASNLNGKFTEKEVLQKKNKQKKITVDELPVSIQNLLKRNEYKEWKLDQAYVNEGSIEYYKVELKKNDQKQTLNLDKYANKVNVLE